MTTETNPVAAIVLSLRAKIEIAAAIAVLIVAVIVFRAWLSEHDARLQAQQTVSTQQTAVDQASTQIKALQDAEAERDKQTAAQIAALQASAAKAVTPEQIAAWIPKQLSAVPQPISISVPPASPANPTPAATASIPEADLAPLRDAITKCQTCSAQLAAAQADDASKTKQLGLTADELTATEKERDAYKQQLAGGTKLERIKKAAKWIAFGAAAGFVATCGSGHCK